MKVGNGSTWIVRSIDSRILPGRRGVPGACGTASPTPILHIMRFPRGPLRRSSLHGLIWLLVALLPLRGWAMGAGMIDRPTMPASAAVVALAAEDALDHALGHAPAGVMPDEAAPGHCHDTQAPAQAEPHHSGCSLCTVCHGGLANPPAFALSLQVAPSSCGPPDADDHPLRDAPRTEHFRPPRPLPRDC